MIADGIPLGGGEEAVGECEGGVMDVQIAIDPGPPFLGHRAPQGRLRCYPSGKYIPTYMSPIQPSEVLASSPLSRRRAVPA